MTLLVRLSDRQWRSSFSMQRRLLESMLGLPACLEMCLWLFSSQCTDLTALKPLPQAPSQIQLPLSPIRATSPTSLKPLPQTPSHDPLYPLPLINTAPSLPPSCSLPPIPHDARLARIALLTKKCMLLTFSTSEITGHGGSRGRGDANPRLRREAVEGGKRGGVGVAWAVWWGKGHLRTGV